MKSKHLKPTSETLNKRLDDINMNHYNWCEKYPVINRNGIIIDIFNCDTGHTEYGIIDKVDYDEKNDVMIEG